MEPTQTNGAYICACACIKIHAWTSAPLWTLQTLEAGMMPTTHATTYSLSKRSRIPRNLAAVYASRPKHRCNYILFVTQF